MADLNSIQLDPSESFYTTTYKGKQVRCSRVTSVIESTHPTPHQLQRWMVNCAVEATYGFVNLPIEDMKKIGWEAHKVVSKQALVIGSQVHQAIHSGVEENLSSDAARACFRGYMEFIKNNPLVRLASELTIYDTDLKIAGTIDDLSLMVSDKKNKKTLYILDWKTSTAIQRNYKIQIVIYKTMLLSFIKNYLKCPTEYPQDTQRIMDTIVAACGKKPAIKCILVRLSKKYGPRVRVFHEKVELTAKEEKQYLAEFKLMMKLHNVRLKDQQTTRGGR